MDIVTSLLHIHAQMPDPRPGGHVGSLRLAIDTHELTAALGLLRRLFDIRITYFDVDGVEADGSEIKPISAYCKARRRDPEFAARCAACDRSQLDQGKRTRVVRVYRCHDGLVEGVVPLYEHGGTYIGSIMFGQMRARGERLPAMSAAHARLRRRLPLADPRMLRDVASMLKWMTEHFLNQALVSKPQPPWSEQADRWIRANLGHRITIAGLALHLGRSPSFVSHEFRRVFGMPLHRYLLQLRIATVKVRLANGENLAVIASSLGFCDAYHLSRVFRAVMGAPPSQFRRPADLPDTP